MHLDRTFVGRNNPALFYSEARQISNQAVCRETRRMTADTENRRMRATAESVLILLIAFAAGGCNSPYHADRGALFGGLTGAGVGALVGNAVGNTGAGAAIGAGVGAVSGAAVGSALDDIEAENRALIASQMGRAVSPGAVTIPDVQAMLSAGVDQQLIVNHIRNNGTATVLTTNDLINLQQSGISPAIIEAMQNSPPRPVQSVAVAPQPVIVEEYHYGNPYWYPRGGVYYRHGRHRHHRPRVSWGMSFAN